MSEDDLSMLIEACRGVEPSLRAFWRPYGQGGWTVVADWGWPWGAGESDLDAWRAAARACHRVIEWRRLKAVYQARREGWLQELRGAAPLIQGGRS